jgi:hypothetical protein
MGGGKSQTSTQSVSIPPEVLARYNSVNATAEKAAATPFQAYGGEFVAPVNQQQQAGIAGTNAAAGQAQPYYQAATNASIAGGQAVDPSKLDINAYMNPYTQNVVNATQAAMNQQFGQQNAAQQAQAIRSGAFGGERAGLQNAQLAGQQSLAESQAISPLYQNAYNTALQTATQQQGVGLSAAQANRAAQQGMASQLAGLGTGAQTAALQGAQAQTAAGTLQQQTQQAGDTAQYQQYLQQQGYPFQVAQFLAGIAEGTGALSGSTTTTTQPAGFFSDERLKTDIKEIGKTNDGQPIYSYKYKGEDRTQIGLMAQDVEKKHPSAIGLMGGYKTVDYKKATEDSERPARAAGGVIPDGFDSSSMGGAVTNDMAGEQFARGGYALGGDPTNPYGAAGYVPAAAQFAPHQLMIAPGLKAPPQSGMSSAMQTGKDIQGLYNFGKSGLVGTAATKDSAATAGFFGGQGNLSGKNFFSEVGDWLNKPSTAASGGLIAPREYADGGDVDPYELSSDPLKKTIEEQKVSQLSLPKSNSTPGSSQSGLGQLAQGLGAAKGLYDMGSGVASGLGSLGTGFSSAANAGTLDSVLGSGFSAANIGLGAEGASAAAPGIMGSIGSGLGSMFAEAPELAFLLNRGGAVPRQAHAAGDRVLPLNQDVVNAAPGLVPPDATIDQPTGIPAEAKSLVVDQPAHDPNASFQRAFGNLMKREGGLGIDNNGAPVNFGINQASHPEVNVRDLTKEDAAQKYRNEYWNAVGGDKLNPDLANVALDTAAMAGPARARNLLQSSGGDPVDMLHQRQQFLQNLVSSGKLNDDGTPRYGPNVAKSWQNRYESMLSDLGAKPQVNLLDSMPKSAVGAAASQMAGTSAPSSTTSDGSGLIDKATSSSFLVPALGFLGSMLASQRPTLGGALGEGLLGGTGAYMAQQKQDAQLQAMQPIIAQRNVEALTALSSGLKQYNAMNGTNLTIQQFSQLKPGEIAKYAGPAAAAAVTGSQMGTQPYSYTPDELSSLVIHHPNGVDIPASADPGYLNAFKAHYASFGTPWGQKLVDFADKQLEKTKTSTLSSAGEVIPTPGAISTAQQGLSGEQRVSASSDFEQKGRDFRTQSIEIENHLNQLSDALTSFRTGADAASRANLDRVMDAIDPDHKFASLHGNDGSNYDKVIKSAFAIQIAQLQGLSARAPAAELNALQKVIPGPDLTPEAVRQIVVNAKAHNQYQQKMYDEYDPEKYGYNSSAYQKDFIRNNNYKDFVNNAMESTAPGAGTSGARAASTSPIPSSQWIVGKVYRDASGKEMRRTSSSWEAP